MRLNRPLCYACKHFDPVYAREKIGIKGKRCKGFPNGIPREILFDRYDHRFPHPYDGGFQFERYTTRNTLYGDYAGISDDGIQEFLELQFQYFEWGRKAGTMLPPDTGSTEGNLLVLLRLYKEAVEELAAEKRGGLQWWMFEGKPPLDFQLLFLFILDAYSKLDAETMARYPLTEDD